MDDLITIKVVKDDKEKRHYVIDNVQGDINKADIEALLRDHFSLAFELELTPENKEAFNEICNIYSVKDLKIGEHFIYRGDEYVKVDEESSFSTCILANHHKVSRFGFRDSSWIQSYIKEQIKNHPSHVLPEGLCLGIEAGEVVPCYNLLQDGTYSLDTVSLMSIGEYSKYKDFITKNFAAFWLRDSMDADEVFYVNVQREIKHHTYDFFLFVQPLVRLKNDVSCFKIN